MIDFDKYPIRSERIYFNEDVDFDSTGHAKLSVIPDSRVYVITRNGYPIKIHSSASVIYCKEYSNMKKVQVSYSVIKSCRVIEINSDDYPECFTIELN